MKNEDVVYYTYLNLIAHPLSEDDLFLKAVREINIKNYDFSDTIRYTIGVSNLKVGDVISFGLSETFDAKLQINNDEYFKKIDVNKYEIIKPFREKTAEMWRLTITYDGVTKTIFIQMYM